MNFWQSKKSLHDVEKHKMCARAHLMKRFEERFSLSDFDKRSRMWGTVSYAKDVALAIVNAPKLSKTYGKMRIVKLLGYGRDYTQLYSVWFGGKTKKVFVVWDTVLDSPVTVLTSDMVYAGGKLKDNWIKSAGGQR